MTLPITKENEKWLIVALLVAVVWLWYKSRKPATPTGQTVSAYGVVPVPGPAQTTV